MVEINIEYNGDLRCKAVHGPSGEELRTDAPVDNQGKGEYFSPTDLVATALGTCLTTILGIIARIEEVDLTGLKVCVEKEMVSAPTRRIGRLRTRIVFPRPLNAELRSKFENGALRCPVKESLHPSIEIPMEFVYPD